MSDTCSNFISPKTLCGETVSNFLFGNPTERLWYLGVRPKEKKKKEKKSRTVKASSETLQWHLKGESDDRITQ